MFCQSSPFLQEWHNYPRVLGLLGPEGETFRAKQYYKPPKQWETHPVAQHHASEDLSFKATVDPFFVTIFNSMCEGLCTCNDVKLFFSES